MKDFKGFKKVSDSGSHATFRHKNGSELKVAKAGLHPKMRKQLDALPVYAADGADLEPPDSLKADDSSSDSQPSGHAPISININSQPMSPTSVPTSMAQGDPTEQSPEYQRLVSDYRSKIPAGSQQEAVMGNPEELARKDYDALQKFKQSPGSLSQFAQGQAQQIGAVANPQDQQASMQSTSAGQVASTDGAIPPPPGDDQGQDASAPAPMPTAAAQPRQMAPQPAMAPATPQQEIHHELTSEDKAWQQDLQNGHITPETYHDLFAKKDTIGKIGTLFGLLLSGAGSGLTGQPNAVMEMMNKQIQNDLSAQKDSKANAQNFLRINQQGILNQAQAKNLTADTNVKTYALANMQMNRAALHSLVQQSQKYPIGSPQRQQAEQQLAFMANAVDAQNANIADVAAAKGAQMKMLTGMTGGGGSQDDQVAGRLNALRYVNPEMAKDLESRYVPGVGVSSVKIPDGVRQELASKQKLLNTGNDLLEYSKTHSNIIPGTPEYRFGVAKAMAFQQEVREGLLGTVFRESEKPLLEKFVSENPAGAFKAFSTQPKLRAIMDNAKIGMSTLKQSYGLPDQGPQVPRGTTQQAGNQQEIRYDAQGNAYVKGPDGRPMRMNQTAAK